MKNKNEDVKRFNNIIKSDALSTLSNTELLSRLSGADIKQIRQIFTYNTKGMNAIHNMSVHEICELTDMTEAKACKLKASMEMGKRLSALPHNKKVSIKTPEDAVSYVMEDMRHLDHEEMKVLLLDAKNYIIGIKTISVGNINSSIIDPRMVFKDALKNGANSLILFHNHPSGSSAFSDADIKVTMRLEKAGELLDIKVNDHITIGDGVYSSYKRGANREMELNPSYRVADNTKLLNETDSDYEVESTLTYESCPRVNRTSEYKNYKDNSIEF